MATNFTSTQTASMTHEGDAGINLGLAVNMYPFYHVQFFTIILVFILSGLRFDIIGLGILFILGVVIHCIP